MRTAECWDRLPRGVQSVQSPSLEAEKTQPDKAPRDLGLRADPAFSRRLERRPPKVPLDMNYCVVPNLSVNATHGHLSSNLTVLENRVRVTIQNKRIFE